MEKMESNLRICVLMATFNGASHLREQMDSILNQEGPEFSIYVSDDGSTDSTLQILQEFANKFPSKIHLFVSQSKARGACANFLSLLQKVDSDLYLFADQDDIWSLDHVQSLYDRYLRLNESEKTMPALIFSDMKIVQADGSPFADSFLKAEKLPNGVEHPHFYFVQNNVSGCVTLFNQALKNLVLKNSDFLKRNLEKIPMHDFFLATTAATFGKIYFVNKTLSAYRMHERNTLGVQNVTSLKHVLDRLNRQSADMERILRYAEFFVEYFKENLGRGEFQVLQEWVNIPSRNKFFRIHFMLKNGFMKYGLLRKCVQLWNA